MTTAALDPEYEDAHARKAEGAPAPQRTDRRRSVSGRASVVTLLVAAGLVTGIAASQVRERAKEASSARESLVTEIRSETAATDQLALQEARLRREVAAVRGTALGQDDQGQALADDLAQLELVTGLTAVQGPGLEVVLDDAKDAHATTTGNADASDGRILDRDLQEVVNALWAAGAEQMAVNGQRLTAQTTIRSAGEAVLVDFRPLSPPYRVQAIGPVDEMEPRFVDGAVARKFQTWTSLYGIGFQVGRKGTLHLPASSPADLRLVRPGTPR
jgi:uncharacterized protein YlxW (UPF0749 family)